MIRVISWMSRTFLRIFRPGYYLRPRSYTTSDSEQRRGISTTAIDLSQSVQIMIQLKKDLGIDLDDPEKFLFWYFLGTLFICGVISLTVWALGGSGALEGRQSKKSSHPQTSHQYSSIPSYQGFWVLYFYYVFETQLINVWEYISALFNRIYEGLAGGASSLVRSVWANCVACFYWCIGRLRALFCPPTPASPERGQNASSGGGQNVASDKEGAGGEGVSPKKEASDTKVEHSAEKKNVPVSPEHHKSEKDEQHQSPEHPRNNNDKAPSPKTKTSSPPHSTAAAGAPLLPGENTAAPISVAKTDVEKASGSSPRPGTSSRVSPRAGTTTTEADADAKKISNNALPPGSSQDGTTPSPAIGVDDSEPPLDKAVRRVALLRKIYRTQQKADRDERAKQQGANKGSFNSSTSSMMPTSGVTSSSADSLLRAGSGPLSSDENMAGGGRGPAATQFVQVRPGGGESQMSWVRDEDEHVVRTPGESGNGTVESARRIF